MIKVAVADGTGSNGSLSVVDPRGLPSGAMVYTEPYVATIGQTKAMVNSTYGADFNQNVGFGGTPDGIHNGTDSVLWTATALAGTWTFDSTAQAYAGTKSIDGTAVSNNSEAQLERSSAISSGSYVALTGAVYIADWSTQGTVKEIELRCRLAGVDVGVSVQLRDYVDETSFGSWQTFTIPMDDFATAGANIDQLIITALDTGGGTAPGLYYDSLQWEETGAAQVWSLEPDTQSIYRLSELNITIADAYDSTLASSSHQKIPYDTLLGVAALSTGINFKLTTNNVVRFSGNFRQHIDFMNFPGITVQSGGDGTNTWMTYNIPFSPEAVLDSRTKDIFELTISEDLSGLLFARVLARGGKQEL